MADAHDCSSSGLDVGPNAAGQVSRFLSATQSLLIGSFRNLFRFRNRGLQNDANTSCEGEHTYYSTAPQELWTEVLSNDLQDLNFASKTQNDEGESSCVEVREFGQSDLLLLQLLAEGKDFVGNVWVVMERMAGDLRTLIDRRMSCLEDGQRPFDYNNTITMMMHIAQGMEDLHRCGLIHADLKASNILVTPVIMDPREVEVDGSQQVSESLYFYMKIGDFESSDGVVGTGFWRAPEVLHALSNDAKPILSPAADVYSYGMLCYELLTGQVPFEKCALSDYDVVLSGQRPELRANVSLTMRELLRACWHTEPRERPGWRSIIETLKEELIIHPPGSQQPKRRAQRRIGMPRGTIQAAAVSSETSNVVVTSWDEVVAQGLGTEAFAPGILPIVKVIMAWRKALRKDRIMMVDGTAIDHPKMPYRDLSDVEEAWDLVGETWNKLVGSVCCPGELTNLTCQICHDGRYKPLGRTGKYFLKLILSTSKEWEKFQSFANYWQSVHEGSFRRWKEEVQAASFAWEKVRVAFHTWHVKCPIASEAWRAVQHTEWEEDVNFKVS
ncbi:unnamed protein product [Sphagnum tenellum]